MDLHLNGTPFRTYSASTYNNDHLLCGWEMTRVCKSTQVRSPSDESEVANQLLYLEQLRPF